jgi:hypothetical protein
MNDQTIIPATESALATTHEPSTIGILQAFVDKGITSENVAAFSQLIALKREEDSRQSKIAFNKSFFRLKTELATMNFYCDKEAKDRSGGVMYSYCSEEEISNKLEPVLFKHGFAMMFGQKQQDSRIIAEITLIHSEGHEEKREYAVRSGATNAAKDATQADTGSTTSAWRHLVIKMFGLKSRISEQGDARNIGAPISFDQAQTLREMVKETKSDEKAFLKFAGAPSYEEIGALEYDRLFRALEMKRR